MQITVRRTEQGLIVPVRVQPKSHRNRVGGEIGGRLKIAVTAPPEKGKANEAACKALADRLGIRPNKLKVISGAASRSKEILIECAAPELIEKALAEILS